MTDSVNSVQVVDISADSDWLMTIGKSKINVSDYATAFVYSRNNETNLFEPFQELVFGLSSEAGAMSDDHSLLIVAEE